MAIWQQSCYNRSYIVIQVGKYLVNNCRVFNAGNSLDETGTFTTFIGLLEGLLMAYSVEKLLFFGFRTFPRRRVSIKTMRYTHST